MTRELGYFVEVGFGTPPKRLQTYLDISSSETFIASVEFDPSKGYNSSHPLTTRTEAPSKSITLTLSHGPRYRTTQ